MNEVHHQRPAVGTEVGGLDHLPLLDVPDGNLAAEAARLDASTAQRRRSEGRADPAVRPVQRLEVVHVLRSVLAGLADRTRPEVPEERTGLVVDLDDAAGLGRVAGRPDHRHHCLTARHAHDAVRDDVAARRDELVVDRLEGQALAAALDVEDVDPASKQSGHEQSLLIGRVAVVVELVTDVRHVDPVDDLAEVSATRGSAPTTAMKSGSFALCAIVLTYRNRSCRFPPFFVPWPDPACSARAGVASPAGLAPDAAATATTTTTTHESADSETIVRVRILNLLGSFWWVTRGWARRERDRIGEEYASFAAALPMFRRPCAYDARVLRRKPRKRGFLYASAARRSAIRSKKPPQPCSAPRYCSAERLPPRC